MNTKINEAQMFSSYNWFPNEKIKQVMSFRGPAKGDNRIAVPITVNGEQYTALLDSGATLSLVSTRVVEELDVRWGKLQDSNIEMIQKGSVIKSAITCDPVQIQCNNRSVERQIHVVDMEYYDFLIGMDLFGRFGFCVEGIELPTMEEEEYPWVPSDDKPSVIPNERPAEELTPEFQEKRKAFTEAIEPFLKRNEDIDPTSFCTLDSMRVTLKVRKGCVIQERSRPFHTQVEKDEVDSTIQKWWDTGVIVLAPTGNPYNSSLTMASRRDLDGNILKYRVCLDPRTLNRQLEETDNFPLPLVTDVVHKVAGYKYFTTIDLSQAYHRMPVDEKSQPYTAFTYSGRQYMFARAPFGLKPLTSIFQRAMSQLLGDLHYCGIYVDDIIIYSKTIEEHVVHVQNVIQRLTEAKLIINREKSRFLSTQVVLLGFVVNKDGRSINREKLANVHVWAYPTNKRMVSRYLGMFGYFREYIPLYSTLAAPLDRLRNARGTFVLTDLQKQVFDVIRKLVQQAPVLSFPDFTLHFYIATDASNVGIGAVLYQIVVDANGKETIRYISFQARSLHKHERNYPAYKKELLGVVFALMKFHQYIWGRRFTLYTDHRPLTFLHEQNELPQILANWKATIFNYDFKCVYRPGLLNIIPDALSRAFPEELWSERKSLDANAVAGATNFRRIDGDSRAVAVNDGPSFILNDQVIDATGEPTAVYVHDVQSENPEYSTVMDAEERIDLLRKTHEFGHLGSNAMVKAIHEKGFTWPKLIDDCLKWVSQCRPCQYFNIARKGMGRRTNSPD